MDQHAAFSLFMGMTVWSDNHAMPRDLISNPLANFKLLLKEKNMSLVTLGWIKCHSFLISHFQKGSARFKWNYWWVQLRRKGIFQLINFERSNSFKHLRLKPLHCFLFLQHNVAALSRGHPESSKWVQMKCYCHRHFKYISQDATWNT